MSNNRIENLDTGQGLLICHLFGIKCDEETKVFKTYLMPYLVVVLIGFIIPLIIAKLTMGNITTPVSDELNLPYLLDWNMNFAMLVSLPFLVVLLLSEPYLISHGLSTLKSDGILTEPDISPYKSWKKKYLVANTIAQAIGLVGGFIAAYTNYQVETVDNFFMGWQFNGASSHISSWIYLCWQLPLLWFFCSVFLLRSIVHIWFLYDLIDKYKIKVKLFHHDRCGGLQSIGKLGLRNQYILTALGINILLLIEVMCRIEGTTISKQAISSIGPDLAIFIVVCMSLYLFGAPLAFLGPLLPFRNKMLEAKESHLRDLAEHYEKTYYEVTRNCKATEKANEDIYSIDRIEKLRAIAEKFPVWPLDTTTLRKFLLALGTPAISAIVTSLISAMLR